MSAGTTGRSVDSRYNIEMELIRDLAAFPTSMRGGVLSIGKFDGLHVGHAEILRALIASARRSGVSSIAFTFEPSPTEILRPSVAPPPLCTLERKIELISSFGPDLLIVFPTTKAFLELDAEAFFDLVVLKSLGASGLIEGANFNFGSHRSGNCDLLERMCAKNRLSFEKISSIQAFGREVSSSRIRSLLRDGQVATARGMLGRPYRLTGCVIHGEHRGRKLGFPTANLSRFRTILPKSGLYAAWASTEFGEFPAAVNLGGNPTFGVSSVKIEAHLIGFSGDLYGRTISLDFLSRLRDIVPFASQEELVEQMKKDLHSVGEITSRQSN